MLTPKEIPQAIIKGNVGRAKLTTLQLCVLGIFAGAFIAFGAQGALTASQSLAAFDPGIAKLVFAAVFPVGLMLVVLCGAELFTGNNLMALAVIDKKCGIKCLLRNWSIVYVANFVGAILIAVAISKTGLASGPLLERVTNLAVYKVGIPVGPIILSAIFCNMIVVLAVWMATAAKDVIGKIFCCWFPIMLFALSGYEHSVANMFFLSLGKFVGAEITWGQIWFNNLIPVTIGNIIGGALIVPLFYYLAYVKTPKVDTEAEIDKAA